MLRAAGADEAELVCICVDDPEAAVKIVELVHGDFKRACTFVRAYDRNHAITLMNMEVDYQLQELFESAIAFSRAALEEPGVDWDPRRRSRTRSASATSPVSSFRNRAEL